MADLETVWDKEGNPHRMSVPNARDMVNLVGWTRVPPASLLAAEKKTAELKAEEDLLKEIEEVKAAKAAKEEAEKIAAEAAFKELEKLKKEAEASALAEEKRKEAEAAALMADEEAQRLRLLQEVEEEEKAKENDEEYQSWKEKAILALEEEDKVSVSRFGEICRGLGLKVDGRLSKVKIVELIKDEVYK